MSTDGNNQDTTPAMKSSRIAGLHRLSVDRRIAEVAEFGDLCRDGLSDDLRSGGLTVSQADNMIENAVGLIRSPRGRRAEFSDRRRRLSIAAGDRRALGGRSLLQVGQTAARRGRHRHNGYRITDDRPNPTAGCPRPRLSRRRNRSAGNWSCSPAPTRRSHACLPAVVERDGSKRAASPRPPLDRCSSSI